MQSLRCVVCVPLVSRLCLSFSLGFIFLGFRLSGLRCKLDDAWFLVSGCGCCVDFFGGSCALVLVSVFVVGFI